MTTSTGTVITPATYRIDPDRSTVQFHVRGAFGHRVRGTFRILGGTIVVDPDLTRSSVTATIDTASVQTQNARRDKDLRSPKFLHTDRHPRMAFTGKPADSTTLTGTLQVQDISQPVTLALSAEPAADGARFRATARIDRYAAGVTKGKGIVARYVDIELDIAAVAMPASQ